MSKKLVGQRIYSLDVLTYQKLGAGKQPLFTARCVCGNVSTFKGAVALRRAKDCGCGAYVPNNTLPQKIHQVAKKPKVSSSPKPVRQYSYPKFVPKKKKSQKELRDEELASYSIVEINGIKHSCKYSKAGNIFFKSCPLVSLATTLKSKGYKLKTENSNYCVINFGRRQGVHPSSYIKPRVIYMAFDKAHQFVQSNFKNIVIDPNFRINNSSSSSYAIGTYLDLPIKTTEGSLIGNLSYTFVTESTVGNARVKLYNNAAYSLN